MTLIHTLVTLEFKSSRACDNGLVLGEIMFPPNNQRIGQVCIGLNLNLKIKFAQLDFVACTASLELYGVIELICVTLMDASGAIKGSVSSPKILSKCFCG